MPSEAALSDKGKRTNSLAFAQTDCHTCISQGNRCDRRRPRCSTCLNRGRRCDGFVTPLSWDPKRMWSDNPHPSSTGPRQKTPDVIDSTEGRLSTAVQPRRFRFIGGASRPKKRRKEHPPRRNDPASRRSVVQDDHHAREHVPNREHIPDLAGEIAEEAMGNQLRDNLDELASSDPFIDDLNLFDSIIPNIFGAAPFLDIGSQETLTSEISGLMAVPRTPPLSTTERSIDSLPGPELTDDPLDAFNPALSDVVQRDFASTGIDRRAPGGNIPTVSARLHPDPAGLDLSNNHDWLLELYDSEFCVLPLTSDIAVNPFRCQRQTSQGSCLLLHSILALCCQHMKQIADSWSALADEHRQKAVRLLEGALQSRQAHSDFHLLEPILILFTLDCTLSASGAWTTHLNRAHCMLQACGGPSALTTPRVRSQVGMLIWWDATLALISRQGPIMDQAYLEFLVGWEKQDEWSFFDLTGCPRELLVYLFQLAELAKQSEIATSMKWLTFNITPVIEIEQKLAQWANESAFTEFENESELSDQEEEEKRFHEQKDRYHCAEAWRHALLLYIECVFKADRQKRPLSVHRLVRKIIDHIKCCRRSSQTQKQLLLPVFLAGSETSDAEMREFVKDYCAYWGEKSRYSMFHSVPVLLDEVWNTGRWWGAVIDSKTRPSSPGYGQGTTQLLLG